MKLKNVRDTFMSSAIQITTVAMTSQTKTPLQNPGRFNINLTGDYVWSDNLAIGADGFMPLRQGAQ